MTRFNGGNDDDTEIEDDDSEEVDLPEDDTPRFAYEFAETVFNEFAQKQAGAYQRAWMAVRFMCASRAHAEWWVNDGSMHPALALARGWEELQIAFTGHGEAYMSGAVLHLWNTLPEDQDKPFRAEIKRAWSLAEEHTPKKAKRLFNKSYRLKEPFDPTKPLVFNPVLPNQGVRVREWALENGFDPSFTEEAFLWIEEAETRHDKKLLRPV